MRNIKAKMKRAPPHKASEINRQVPSAIATPHNYTLNTLGCTHSTFGELP